MKVYRALGAAVVLTCASMACSDTPSTPTSASSSTGGAAVSPFDVKYTVTASAGANGSISPSGTVSVSASGIQGFKITPDANYHVADVLVDGSSVGAVTSHTFTGVLTNHTISASFATDALNGLFAGSMVLTGVSGGECVGTDLNARVGSVDLGTVTITQKQNDVTAIVRSATTGLQCSYTGNTRSGSFAVNAASCDAAQLIFQCANGQTRLLEAVGSTLTGTIAGDATSGNVATTYNVFDRDHVPIAGLVTQQSFNATRR